MDIKKTSKDYLKFPSKEDTWDRRVTYSLMLIIAFSLVFMVSCSKNGSPRQDPPAVGGQKTEDKTKIQSSPNNHDKSKALLNEACRLIEADKIEEALKTLNMAIDTDPENTEAYACRGRLAMERGDFKSSLNDINKAIKLNPKGIVLYRFRSELYQNMKKYDLAVRDLNVIMKSDPDDIDTLIDLGQAYMELDRNVEALINLEEAKTIAESPQAQKKYENIDTMKKKINQCIAKIRKTNSDESPMTEKLSAMLVKACEIRAWEEERDKLLKEIISRSNRAIKTGEAKRYPIFYLLKSEALSEHIAGSVMEDIHKTPWLEEALDSLDHYEKIKGKNEYKALLNRAHLLIDLSQARCNLSGLDEASNIANKLLKRDNKDHFAYEVRAKANLYRLINTGGQMDAGKRNEMSRQVVSNFDKYFILGGTVPENYKFRGTAYIYFNKEKAREEFDNYLNLLKAQEGTEILLESAEISLRMCDYGKALTLINRLIKEEPDVASFYMMRALNLEKLGKQDEARKDFEKSRKLLGSDKDFNLMKKMLKADLIKEV